MKIPIYHIDAFTDKVFGGNPAAVCPLEQWPADDVLLNIARENNLAETAFFVLEEEQFHIRWFTPDIEMDLCGHATLATAYVIFNKMNFLGNKIVFKSVSGQLSVKRNKDLLMLDFPTRMPEKVDLPDVIEKGIGKKPVEVYKSRDYVLVYESEEDIKTMMPDEDILNTINLDPGGIVVTAKGSSVDFVSRFFTPQATIFEDPVTGSAHCSLIPLWAQKLGKDKLTALQLSERGGELFCGNRGDRVEISGKAVTFMEGFINIE